MAPEYALGPISFFLIFRKKPKMNTRLRISILCLSLLFSFQLFSQSPTAEQLALQFLSNRQQQTLQPESTPFDKAEKHNSIWIFEKENPKCFVLVKEASPPYIIGYSLDNLFFAKDTTHSPIPMILESLDAVSPDHHPDTPGKSTFNPIGPMVQTHWGQDQFFNFFCPADEASTDGHVLVGCAAVAMGQIMRYYGKFNKFSFPVTYQSPKYGPLHSTMGNFQWEQMEDAPLTIDLETSRLLFSLGILTEMAYSPNFSTTSNFMAYNGFKQTNYLDAKRMIRIETDSVSWLQTFYDNIADSKPLYVSGSGHAYVCDGMDATGMLHMNLGWSGYADGYYDAEVIAGLEVEEAICDIKPYSSLLPPVNLVANPVGDDTRFSWSNNPQSTLFPIGYRVYLNDTLFIPTLEPNISSQSFPPGHHAVKVSAVYSAGESRWIGPLNITVKGTSVAFNDPQLKQIIESEYNKQFTPPTTDLTIDQALQIRQLSVSAPVASLSGIETCKNLQILTINGTGQTLDLSPVSSLTKLKSLVISNIRPSKAELLGKNQMLSELRIENAPLSNIMWVFNLPDMITLSFNKMNLKNINSTLNFSLLESLIISNCQVTQPWFFQAMPRLAHLDLSENMIQTINWSDTLANLRDLNLAHNQITDCQFLAYIPAIKQLDLSHNFIPRFVTEDPLDHLHTLNLSWNSIDSIHFAYPASELQSLYLASNQLKSTALIKSEAPNLTHLDISNNQLKQLWDGCLQNLTFLNVADNSLTHLNKIPNYPSLTHLECQGNRIADIYPLVSREYYNQLTCLDITNNPLSAESLVKFMPRVLSQVDTLIYPAIAESRSPGYPVPLRNQTLSDTTVALSWSADGVTAPSYYELWMGYSPDQMSVITSQLYQPTASVTVDPGRNYYWMVRTVAPDTSFLSGIFHFKTFTPISLPFNETMETHELASYISDLSKGWIVPWNDSTAIEDGRIIDTNVYEGSHALSIITQTGLQLPLNHLVQKTLRIKMQMFVDRDCTSCIKFLDINGSDMVLFFKPQGRCDIYFDGAYFDEIIYPTNQWFQLALTAYGNSGNVQLKFGKETYSFPWLFPNGNVCIGEMDLCCLSGSVFAENGFDQFLIDNLNITAQDVVSTSIIPTALNTKVFPNPADQYADIDLPGESTGYHPVVFDRQGKNVRVHWNRTASNRIRLYTEGLPAGLYYITISDRSGVKPITLLITH